MSSDDTRSDTTGNPNGPAIRAMWIDAARYAVDDRRVYAAAFSGLAQSAWALAANKGRVAGVIVSGGRVSADVSRRPMTAAFFGTAGRRDFNYLEMKRLEALAAGGGVPARLEVFDGDHEWLPPTLAAEAVAWLEIIAMRDHTRALDAAFVAERLAAERAAAEMLEREGRVVDALQRYEVIASSYRGLGDVAFADDRARALRASPEVSRALENVRRWDDWETREAARAQARLRAAPALDGPGSVNDLATELGLPSLKARAKKPGDEGEAAQRVVSALYTDVSYYIWRTAMERGDFQRGIDLQQLAIEIDPGAPGAWYRLAVSSMRAGDRRQAIQALERAEALGLSAAAAVEQETAFERLRGDARFEAVLSRMRARTPPR
jgi:tetratricopeptide (TPR) repeat protein